MSNWNLPPGVTPSMLDPQLYIEDCCPKCPHVELCCKEGYCLEEARADDEREAELAKEHEAWHSLYRAEKAQGLLPERNWKPPCACSQLNGECSRAKQCLHGC